MLVPGDHRVEPFVDATRLLGDPAAVRAQADELGYLYFPNLLPESIVGPVRQFARGAFAAHGWVQAAASNPPYMEAVPGAKLEGRGWDDRRWRDFQYLFSSNTDFLALAEHDRILSLLDAVIGEPAWCAAVNFCWLKLPGSPEHTTLPHQDEWYLPRCPHMWTMWLPLVDTPFDVGPLGVIPGSHHRGLRHHANAFTGIEVAPNETWASGGVRAGDVVFFAARTVHCAWSNVSRTRARVSADVRYEPRSVGAASFLRPQPD